LGLRLRRLLHALDSNLGLNHLRDSYGYSRHLVDKPRNKKGVLESSSRLLDVGTQKEAAERFQVGFKAGLPQT
jgi:hypothetical protein